MNLFWGKVFTLVGGRDNAICQCCLATLAAADDDDGDDSMSNPVVRAIPVAPFSALSSRSRLNVKVFLMAAIANCALFATLAQAQSNTKIERMPPVAASRLLNGLGWNVDLHHEWEFQKVRSAHGREVRMQFSWGEVESFSTGALALPPAFQKALEWCRIYQLEPLIVAAYGPPAARLAEVTLSSDVPPGATTLPVSGDLGLVNPPACHIMKADRTHIVPERRWSYQGALIHAVDAAAHTLTLAAATNVALSAGTKLHINQLRYPTAATNNPADPSLIAYHRYVRFLADQIAAAGLTGRVEIWNEPPWAHDPWDSRGAFYDNDKVPAGITRESPNWGILRTLLADTLPAGVRYAWGGSHKSGSRGVLFLPAPAATQAQVSASVSSESWHPYGPTPEWHLWELVPNNASHGSQSPPATLAPLEGASPGSNFKTGRRRAAENLQNLHWTIAQQISETGLPGPDQTAKARYVVRYFLAHMAAGPLIQLDRVNFYRLAERADGYGMIDSATRQELPPYIALKELMNDLSTLAVAPLNPGTPSAADFAPNLHADANPQPQSQKNPKQQQILPTAIAPYAGHYPLMTIPIIGRSAITDTRDSCLLICYQRTYADTEKAWSALVPSAVPVQIILPKDTTLQSATDLVTRQAIPISYTPTGADALSSMTATLPISANPIALKIIPTSQQ